MSDQTQAQFDAEAADYAAMGISPAADLATMMTQVTSRPDSRALLISRARAMAATFGIEGRRDYLRQAGSEYAERSDEAVEGAFLGCIKDMVNSLADALERELARNA